MAAVTDEPPPKRRRTEEVDVAETNSTLNIFMGHNQRQHRWMQGYVPKPRDEHVVRQTQAPVAQNSLGDQRHPQVQRPPTTRTASSPAAATAHAGTSNLVHYESPVTSAALYSNTPPMPQTASRKSRVISGASVGLPSPVSSDDTTNSPAIMSEMPAARRGRPPNATRNSVPAASVVPSNASAALRAHSQMQPPCPPPARPQQYSRTEHPAYAPFGVLQFPSNAPPGPATLPGHSHPIWPQMLQQLEIFERSTLSKLNNLNQVDVGRITLLREAIEKHDWFYVCLSQIHCLTVTPAALPGQASKLSMQAVSYLDNLLCANSKLSSPVLRWLSDFPATIKQVYSSPAHVMYEKTIHEVVDFVQRLPTLWDGLMDECKKRGAPPLMDDFEKIMLRSQVLQTTMFRAIARVIQESSDCLEQLHRLDQQAFLCGQSLRTPYEKTQAFNAFRDAINQLREYEKTPVHRRKRFMIPPKALAVFQARIPIPIPAPTPVHLQSAPLNRSNTTQRQLSIHLNGQQTSHNRHVSINASTTLPQPGTTNSPMMVASGCFPIPKQQHAPTRRLIFLHETEQPRAQPTHPDTMRSALHQAHLRSPTLTPTDLDSPRLYRHVTAFALPPRKIKKALPVEAIEFNVSQELYDALPSITPSDRPGAPGSHSLSEKTFTIRLRCASGTDKALASESSWIEAENYWPDNLYLQCNSHMLDPRRKLHHNRYLPIDITAIVKPGRNQLTVVVNRISTDNRPYDYALAVEIVGLTSHDAITKSLKHIPAPESLEAIKKSLAASGSDDDDIFVTTSTTIIQLFDPHTLTKIFDIPVRGAACPHRDCFDLETFLSQRDPKNKPRLPSVVDCWRCPICRGDVRPQTLIRDGFMDEVREELARKKMLDTRQIVVEPNGSWKPKEEDTGGIRSPSLEREERGCSAKATTITSSATKASAPKVVEIIEID